jgi:hypothetical protein
VRKNHKRKTDVLEAMYAEKNLYAINNNGARNWMIENGIQVRASRWTVHMGARGSEWQPAHSHLKTDGSYMIESLLPLRAARMPYCLVATVLLCHVDCGFRLGRPGPNGSSHSTATAS